MNNNNLESMLTQKGNLLVNLKSPMFGVIEVIQSEGLHDIRKIIETLEIEGDIDLNLESPVYGLLETLDNTTVFMINSIRSNVAYIHGVMNIVDTLEANLVSLTNNVVSGKIKSTDDTFVKLVNLRKLMDNELKECIDIINNNERFYPELKSLLLKR